MADWIAKTRDSDGSAFLIVDKKNTRVYAFDGNARLRGSAAALLGSAVGDDSVAGIGTRPISQVRPEERTTPAGRFVAERGHNTQGEDVIWLDYDAAVSIHRLRSIDARDRRPQRLATPTARDNRISYGCINLPAEFYETQVRPIFASHRAIVYVLPEVRSVQEVFGLYNIALARGLASGPAE
ncbi:MAG: L,D-transpeptidase [Panacagrimonas sp.]